MARTTRTYDHFCMLARALEQVGDADRPEWRRVAEFAGVTDNTNVKRYREHCSLSVAATTS
jgi:hypothetical protein